MDSVYDIYLKRFIVDAIVNVQLRHGLSCTSSKKIHMTPDIFHINSEMILV